MANRDDECTIVEVAVDDAVGGGKMTAAASTVFSPAADDDDDDVLTDEAEVSGGTGGTIVGSELAR